MELFHSSLKELFFLDRNCEEVLNQTGTATINWFKIIIAAGGQSLATVACSFAHFVLCLGWGHGRRDTFRIQVLQACPQLWLPSQASF